MTTSSVLFLSVLINCICMGEPLFAKNASQITDEIEKIDALPVGIVDDRINTGEDTPWEPFEAQPKQPDFWCHTTAFDPVGMLAAAALNYYNTHVSPKSIARCPFKISCSAFARKAINKYGFFLGSAMFFDRFLYREHKHAIEYYKKTLTDEGVLKLNDTLYLGF